MSTKGIRMFVKRSRFKVKDRINFRLIYKEQMTFGRFKAVDLWHLSRPGSQLSDRSVPPEGKWPQQLSLAGKPDYRFAE